jgi:hypothetical protein
MTVRQQPVRIKVPNFNVAAAPAILLSDGTMSSQEPYNPGYGGFTCDTASACGAADGVPGAL